MEALSEALSKIEKTLQPQTSAVQVRKSNAASVDEILVVIGKLELRKQIKPLTDMQRIELAELLYRLEEPLERIQERARSVLLEETYGTIAYHFWVKDLICLRSEARQIAEKIIEDRRKRFKAEYQHSNLVELEKKAAELGLQEIEIYWNTELRIMVAKFRERMEKKFKTLRAQYYQLPAQAKMDLWAKAVEKGIVKDGDEFADRILPLLVPKMVEEFETAIKSNSTVKSTA